MSTRGKVFFTGADHVKSADFTLTHGVVPDTALLQIVPQGSITSDYGTLTFQEDDINVSFAGCHVRFGSIRYNSRGQVVAMEIEDRRWRWANGVITGHYNAVLSDGTIDESTRRTVWELAAMLFAEMGETATPGALAELPNLTYPEVDWFADEARSELVKLVGSLGCRVTLGIDNLSYIRRLGFGSPLPRTNAKTISIGTSSAALPTDLVVIGARALFQSKLKLDAIGLDTDGVWKPIDGLSYRPDGGWEGEYETLFQSITDPLERALAQRTVFRCYWVDSQADGSNTVPGYGGSVTSINQILPVHNFLIDSYVDGVGGTFAKRGFVEGTFKLGGDPDPRTNSEDFALLELDYTLDEDQGILTFDHPVVKMSGDGFSDNEKIKAADLYFVASYAVKMAENGQLAHFFRGRTIGPPLFGTKVFKDFGIQNVYVASYDGSSVIGVTHNTAVCELEANHILDAMQAEYAPYEVGDVSYIGLVPIQVTGVVRQWSVHIGAFATAAPGVTTRASFNGEHDRFVLSHDERKRLFDPREQLTETVRYARRRGRGER